MTDEVVANAEEMLAALGFEHHPEDDWNAINIRKHFGEYGYLVAWGRGSSGIILQWAGKDEANCMGIIETIDIPLLKNAVELASKFIENLALLTSAPQPVAQP